MQEPVRWAERADSQANFTESGVSPPFQVTDLKQWAYCARILYYAVCLPDVRPTTYKMQAGIEAAQGEEGREARRSLRTYGLVAGRREFNVRVESQKLGLRGVVDLVIWIEEGRRREVIPVDYKLSRLPGAHFKLQLAAYGLLLEEASGYTARRGFLYSIPKRQAEPVSFTPALRNKVLSTLDAMHRMLASERLPEATRQRNKCLSCEFRRFCNDVL